MNCIWIWSQVGRECHKLFSRGGSEYWPFRPFGNGSHRDGHTHFLRTKYVHWLLLNEDIVKLLNLLRNWANRWQSLCSAAEPSFEIGYWCRVVVALDSHRFWLWPNLVVPNRRIYHELHQIVQMLCRRKLQDMPTLEKFQHKIKNSENWKEKGKKQKCSSGRVKERKIKMKLV